MPGLCRGGPIDLLILRGRPTADRDLELLVLRQELLVPRRAAPRPRWRVADRLILAALGRKLSAGALLLVQPATVLGWHQALVHRRWAAFGRRRGSGRPKLPTECIRRECLDWLLIVGRQRLELVLTEYVEHHNGHRPHRSLELRPPCGSTMIPAALRGQVVGRTHVHGLVNEYSRQAD